MGWLTILINLVEEVPQVISIIEKVVNIVRNSEKSPEVVKALGDHVSAFDSSVIGNGPSLKS